MPLGAWPPISESHVEMVPQLARYLIEAGGKRLRPMLTVAAAMVFGKATGAQTNYAAAVEFMHNATLLHDDVVDESDLRRGRPAARIIWGNQSLMLNAPPGLTGPVELPGGMQYASYRLAIIAVGLLVALLLYFLVTKTRIGMLVRAGASNREMALAMGVDIRRLFTGVFALGAALCALAGAMLGPILAVQVGMGGPNLARDPGPSPGARSAFGG